MDLHIPKESGTYFMHFSTTSEEGNHCLLKTINTYANILILEHLIKLEHTGEASKEIAIFFFRVITACERNRAKRVMVNKHGRRGCAYCMLEGEYQRQVCLVCVIRILEPNEKDAVVETFK